METAISTLTLMPASKEQVENFANQLINSVKSGVANALELKTRLKFLEAVIKKVDEETKAEQLSEFDKYGAEKSANVLGYIVERMEAATTYDYASTGDAKWAELNEQVKRLNENKKERENFLRTIKQPISIVDEATGEIATITPPVKRSTTTLKFTLK